MMFKALMSTLLMIGAAHAEPIKVGVVESPPFAWQTDTGEWTGVAVTLWTQTAEDAGLQWTPVKVDRVDDMLDQVHAGTLDIAIGGLTVTPERATEVDFLPAFEVSSIGVATPTVSELQFGTLLGALSNSAFVGLSVIVIALVVLFGIAIWLAERRANGSEFGGHHHHGLGSGLWWSMVTMSTVGYGDKSPKTWIGRTIAGIWIVLALVLVSVFTGAAASAFTQRAVSTTATTWELQGKRIGVIEGGETERWLNSRGVRTVQVVSTAEGLRQVAKGELHGMAGDTITLRWTMLEHFIDDLTVRGGLRQERLAFVARPGLSSERELTVSMLRVLQSDEWARTLRGHGWPASNFLH